MDSAKKKKPFKNDKSKRVISARGQIKDKFALFIKHTKNKPIKQDSYHQVFLIIILGRSKQLLYLRWGTDRVIKWLIDGLGRPTALQERRRLWRGANTRLTVLLFLACSFFFLGKIKHIFLGVNTVTSIYNFFFIGLYHPSKYSGEISHTCFIWL